MDSQFTGFLHNDNNIKFNTNANISNENQMIWFQVDKVITVAIICKIPVFRR